MKYTEIFKVEKKKKKNENFHFFFLYFSIFFSKHRLWVLKIVGTHNLCFGAKIRKIGIPLQTPVFLYKSGVQGGILFKDMFS